MKIGILAWAVRHSLERDFAGTLRALSEQGYQGIHFLGDFGGLPAVELSTVLAELDLEACAIHSNPKELLDAHSTTYDYARELGCKYVTTSLSKPDFATNYRVYAETCRQMNAIASDKGLTFSYHNHGIEFAVVDEGIAYDLFCACLDGHVKLNFNALWAQMGGVDPIRYLATYLSKTSIMHIGDCDADASFCDLGHGVVPLPEIMALVEGRVAWAICDHSNEADEELGSARRCMAYLQRLGILTDSPPSKHHRSADDCRHG